MLNACPGWVHSAEVGGLESNNLLCHEENEDLSLDEKHLDTRNLSDSQTSAFNIYNHLCSSLRGNKVVCARLMAKISVQDLPND